MPNSPTEPRPPASSPPRDATPKAEGVRVLESADLFPQGTAEVRLRHRGEEYRLRITRQGKLILTK